MVSLGSESTNISSSDTEGGRRSDSSALECLSIEYILEWAPLDTLGKPLRIAEIFVIRHVPLPARIPRRSWMHIIDHISWVVEIIKLYMYIRQIWSNMYTVAYELTLLCWTEEFLTSEGLEGHRLRGSPISSSLRGRNPSSRPVVTSQKMSSWNETWNVKWVRCFKMFP